MWIILLATLAVDTTVRSVITVAPQETLSVTVTGNGTPVVLIPGLFGSAYGFRHLVGPLAEDGYRAITIEPLGVGTSSRPKNADYSLTAQAARLAAALDSLDVTGAILMAHSVNSAIAYRLAITRPDLVAGIVAVEGGVAESATTDGFRRAMKFAWLLKLVGGPDMVRAQVHQNLRKASVDTSWITDDAIAAYTAGATADVGATIDAFKSMAKAEEPWALAPRLAEIVCPVRVLVGSTKHRSAPPEEQLALLVGEIPDVAIDSVADVGHFMFEERPEIVLSALVQIHLRSKDSSAPVGDVAGNDGQYD